jgi:catechol 2,3-dioxygenase
MGTLAARSRNPEPQRTSTMNHNQHDPVATPAQPAEYGIAPPGYQLSGSLKLGRVILQVADLDRSLQFYRQVLGLRTAENGDGRATLAAHGEDGVLIELRERRGAAPVPVRGRIGLYHFAILLPDRAALGRFVAHLADTGVRAGASDHLVSEALYLSDPDGLGIEVYADRPREQWRHAQRQLVMSTEPLDLRDVARAAGGETWTGIPAGTRIGHVHLHVGDIERAADFYHQGLGFDKVVWSYPGALFLSAGGYHHHLGVNTWAAHAPAATAEDARLIEWQIVLPDVRDVQAAARSLEEHGFAVEREGGGATVLARDPWGTALRLTVDGASVLT